MLVKKTEEIRFALGSLPPVVVGKLNDLLAKGINPTAIAAMIEEIGGVDQSEGFKCTQALMSVELEDSRERKTRSRYDSEADQLAFSFASDEQAQLRQLRDNRNHWEKRLARIDQDLEQEPAAIRRTFEVSTAPRIEPAGAIYLWPLEVSR